MNNKTRVIIFCFCIAVLNTIVLNIIVNNNVKIISGYNEHIKTLEESNDQLHNDYEELLETINALDKRLNGIEGSIQKSKMSSTSRGGISRKPSCNINNLTEKSNVTEEHLKARLEGTPLHDVAMDYIIAEENSGINAIFLCAVSIEESGWGRSRLARDKNNLFGYGAYNDSPYSSAKGFPSKGECIVTVGNRIANNYLMEDGKYYNGKSLDAVNIRYSLNDNGEPNKGWSRNIRQIIKQLID